MTWSIFLTSFIHSRHNSTNFTSFTLFSRSRFIVVMIASIVEDFNEHTIMQSMKAYLTQLQTRVTNDVRIHEHVTSFQKEQQKNSYLESLESDVKRADQQHCIIIVVVVKDLSRTKELTLITSDTKEETRFAHESSSWHFIWMLRDNDTLWVFDSIFDFEKMKKKYRIDQITKVTMLKTLWIHCDKMHIVIRNVCILEVVDEQNQCLSLVCLWMKDMIVNERSKWSNLKNCANFNWREIIKWRLQDRLVCFCWIQLCLHVL